MATVESVQRPHGTSGGESDDSSMKREEAVFLRKPLNKAYSLRR